MAQEETITILRVGTDEAVRNIADLKDNVKVLKSSLDQLEIGTEEYQDALDELKVNQNALRDAMHASTASMDDVAKAATGASQSYNGLVHLMANLKEELRATDVSTEQGKQRFKELATTINSVNDQLKEMDAMQGNFQRNVGNYESHWKGLAKNADALKKSLEATRKGIGGVKDGADALAASPAIATFGLLVSVAMKLVDSMKENETAMAGVKKGMAALQPVMDFFSGIVEKLAEFLADIIGKVSAFITSNGLFSKIINGLVGVGNAIINYVIAPFKGVIAAIKVFKEQGIKGIGDAAKAFGQEMKSGFAFKQNFQAGQAWAEATMEGAKSKKKEAVDAGKQIGDEMAKGLKLSDWQKALAAGDKKLEEERKRNLDDIKEINDLIAADYEETIAEIEDTLAELATAEAAQRKEDEERAKNKIATLNAVASATSSVLGSIADMYEADEENAEKNAEKIKALRIASATIDTIQGAIGAFMQATATIAPPFGQIIGAAQAAAITAAGLANISKIRATKVGSGASGGASFSATASAPVVNTQVTQTRQITSASEEARINEMASGKNLRAYIVSSDLEGERRASAQRESETSF